MFEATPSRDRHDRAAHDPDRASSIRWPSPASRRSLFPRPGQRQPDRRGRQGDRLRADRPGLRRATAISTAGRRHGGPIRRRDQDVPAPYNAANSRLQPRPDHPEADRARAGRRREAARPRTRRAGAGRPRDHLGQRPRSAHLAGRRLSRCRASPRRAACRRSGCASWSTQHIEGRCSASWASRGSTCCGSTWRSMRYAQAAERHAVAARAMARELRRRDDPRPRPRRC